VKIGRESLRMLLHERKISFQRTRTWKESKDPDKESKLDRIEYVTSTFFDRCFAFDQFGPLSIRPCHGLGWAPQTRPDLLPATYHRTHGIRYFHGCYSLGYDQLWGINREHKGGANTLAALKNAAEAVAVEREAQKWALSRPEFREHIAGIRRRVGQRGTR
jgi:hypothetical protein